MINLWYVVADTVGVNIGPLLVITVYVIKYNQLVLVLCFAQPLYEITDNSFKVTIRTR
jgi:hypothetical protein